MTKEEKIKEAWKSIGTTDRDLARLQGSRQIIQTQKTLKIYDK